MKAPKNPKNTLNTMRCSAVVANEFKNVTRPYPKTEINIIFLPNARLLSKNMAE